MLRPLVNFRIIITCIIIIIGGGSSSSSSSSKNGCQGQTLFLGVIDEAIGGDFESTPKAGHFCIPDSHFPLQFRTATLTVSRTVTFTDTD